MNAPFPKLLYMNDKLFPTVIWSMFQTLYVWAISNVRSCMANLSIFCPACAQWEHVDCHGDMLAAFDNIDWQVSCQSWKATTRLDTPGLALVHLHGVSGLGTQDMLQTTQATGYATSLLNSTTHSHIISCIYHS